MDRSELELELERLHEDCWGWALACCARDRELAEEALQTAYLRILSGRARFGGTSSVKTWVFGVIRLTAREEARSRRRRVTRLVGEDAVMKEPDSAVGADVSTEEAERRETLVVALAALSPRQREVLQLVFYHDLTIEEAAAVMQVSLGSARTHYERGKKALAGMLGSEVRR